MKERIENLIFDWSGTLVDDFSYTLAVTNQMFREHSLDAWSAEDLREKFFLPHVRFYQLHFPHITAQQVEVFFKDHFDQFKQTMGLLPYARELLNFGKQEAMPLFLLSAIYRTYYEERARALKVGDYFQEAYVESHNKHETLAQLLKDHQLDPKKTLFVGDMQHDIEAARHCGVLSAGVLTGYDSRAKLEQVRPDFLFDNLKPLLELLQTTRAQPSSAAATRNSP